MLAAAFTLLAALASASPIAKRTTPDALIAGFTSSPMQFNYPPPRAGFNASQAAYDPCGGQAAGARATFPLSGGSVSVQSLSVAANVQVMYVKNADPTHFHQFSSYAPTVLDMSPGGFCAPAPDFGALGMAAGDDVTLMLFYQMYGAETYYYQCADVSLVAASAYVAPAFACANSSSLLTVASDKAADGQSVAVYAASAGASAATATVMVKDTSKLSTVAGGGIGAAVGVAFAAAVVALASVFGVVHFGKRRVVLNDGASVHTVSTTQTNLKAEVAAA
ncbi:hypothetical protein Q8F55_008403 [Vanrija albida]|uniref:Copper acquisition factor BIM1-like domain-containing protein n=1 Tax=Vanrija albida TaxID=181172 RepID=A0ABR3PWH2_9TREE